MVGERAVDAFEDAQAGEGPVDLALFLPEADHLLYPAVLCELVRIDMEYRWTRGRPAFLEEYLTRFPSRERDPERLRQAAFEECRLRRQAARATPAFGVLMPSAQARS